MLPSCRPYYRWMYKPTTRRTTKTQQREREIVRWRSFVARLSVSRRRSGSAPLPKTPYSVTGRGTSSPPPWPVRPSSVCLLAVHVDQRFILFGRHERTIQPQAGFPLSFPDFLDAVRRIVLPFYQPHFRLPPVDGGRLHGTRHGEPNGESRVWVHVTVLCPVVSRSVSNYGKQW